MLPLFDENPVARRPLVNWLVIGVCCLAWAVPRMASDGDPSLLLDDGAVRTLPTDLDFPLRWAAIPCEVLTDRPLTAAEVAATYYRTGDPASCDPQSSAPAVFPGKRVRLAIVTSMFLHGGLAHLGLNMWFLWVFGNNVEDRLGHLAYAGFFLLGGVVATVAFVAARPAGTVALLGASGAVAGVMGAYATWYPDAPIRTLLFLVLVDIRARWYLAGWFGAQFLTRTERGAWITHVSGFAFGLIAGRIVRKIQPRLRLRVGQEPPAWDDTGGAGHGPYPHLDEVWDEPHHERYG